MPTGWLFRHFAAPWNELAYGPIVSSSSGSASAASTTMTEVMAPISRLLRMRLGLDLQYACSAAIRHDQAGNSGSAGKVREHYHSSTIAVDIIWERRSRQSVPRTCRARKKGDGAMKKGTIVLLVTVLLLLALVLPALAAPATPAADTYFGNGTPNNGNELRIFGAAGTPAVTTCAVGGVSDYTIYLKWDVSSYDGQSIAFANLQLSTTAEVAAGGPVTFALHAVDDDTWSESDTSPVAYGAELATAGPLSLANGTAGQIISFSGRDLASFVDSQATGGDGTASFAVRVIRGCWLLDQVAFGDSEGNPTLAPQLLLTGPTAVGMQAATAASQTPGAVGLLAATLLVGLTSCGVVVQRRRDR
jgi:hypothetical protein